MSTTRPPEPSRPEYGDPVTRNRILEAAWHVVVERGQAAGLGDVARAAGVSRQAVYLHFGDRRGLMVALVDFVDARQGGLGLRMHVQAAPTGVDAMRRWIEVLSTYHSQIDRLSQVLECGQYVDESLAAAWRDRMGRRRVLVGIIVGRIAEDGALDPGWTVAAATDLVYAFTMPGPWRELTSGLGWSAAAYAERVLALVSRGLLTPQPVRESTRTMVDTV